MIEQPQFRTVLRGFDPDQVTAAITEVTTSLAIARRTAAERTMELTKAQEREAALNADLDEAVARLAAQGESSNSHVFGEVGTRVSAILSLADEEAGHLRVESERYADEVRRQGGRGSRADEGGGRRGGRCDRPAGLPAGSRAARGRRGPPREDAAGRAAGRADRRGGPSRGGRRGPSHPGRVRREGAHQGRDRPVPRRASWSCSARWTPSCPRSWTTSRRGTARSGARIVPVSGLKCEPGDDTIGGDDHD